MLNRHKWAGVPRDTAMFKHPKLGTLCSYCASNPNYDWDKIKAIDPPHAFHLFPYKNAVEFAQSAQEVFRPVIEEFDAYSLMQLDPEQRIEALTTLFTRPFLEINNLHPVRDDCSRASRFYFTALAKTVGLELDFSASRDLGISRLEAILDYKRTGSTDLMEQIFRAGLSPAIDRQETITTSPASNCRHIVFLCYSKDEGDAFYAQIKPLQQELERQGHHVSVVEGKDWADKSETEIRQYLECTRKLSKLPCVLCLELPHLGLNNENMGFIKDYPVVAHYHELEKRPKQLPQHIHIAETAEHIIVSTAGERAFLIDNSTSPEIANKTSIIPIGATIHPNKITDWQQRSNNPICFGFLHQGNGSDKILACAQEILQQRAANNPIADDLQITVAGGIWPGNVEFIKGFIQQVYDLTNDEMLQFPELIMDFDSNRDAINLFIKQAVSSAYQIDALHLENGIPDLTKLNSNRNPLPIDFYPHATDQQVSDLMNQAKFRLNLSRRGIDPHSSSTPTSVVHGNLQISTVAADYPELDKCVVKIEQNDSPAQIISKLLNAVGMRQEQVDTIKHNAQTYLVHSWQSLATQYSDIFEATTIKQPVRHL